MTSAFRYFFLTAMYLYSCKEVPDNYDMQQLHRRNIDTIVRDIPKNSKGEYLEFYKTKRKIENMLGLEPIESGWDSMQIRLWWGHTATDTGHLIKLEKNKGIWKAEVTLLAYFFSQDRQIIDSVVSHSVVKIPISGWSKFYDSLDKLKITLLPDMNSIKGYPVIADGDGVVVEVATSKYYRIYHYHAPFLAANYVREAKLMSEIVRLLTHELQIKPNFQGESKLSEPLEIIHRPAIYVDSITR